MVANLKHAHRRHKGRNFLLLADFNWYDDCKRDATGHLLLSMACISARFLSASPASAPVAGLQQHQQRCKPRSSGAVADTSLCHLSLILLRASSRVQVDSRRRRRDSKQASVHRRSATSPIPRYTQGPTHKSRRRSTKNKGIAGGWVDSISPRRHHWGTGTGLLSLKVIIGVQEWVLWKAHSASLEAIFLCATDRRTSKQTSRNMASNDAQWAFQRTHSWTPMILSDSKPVPVPQW